MITNIISSVMALFGIYTAPVTVSEFLWDCIILFVGLYIMLHLLRCENYQENKDDKQQKYVS